MPLDLKVNSWVELDLNYRKELFDTPESISELSKLISGHNPTITKLCLRDCGIDDRKIKLLLDQLVGNSIGKIDLSDNDIGPAGVGPIISQLEKLREIDIDGYKIGAEGTKLLTKKFPNLVFAKDDANDLTEEESAIMKAASSAQYEFKPTGVEINFKTIEKILKLPNIKKLYLQIKDLKISHKEELKALQNNNKIIIGKAYDVPIKSFLKNLEAHNGPYALDYLINAKQAGVVPNALEYICRNHEIYGYSVDDQAQKILTQYPGDYSKPDLAKILYNYGNSKTQNMVKNMLSPDTISFVDREKQRRANSKLPSASISK